MHAADLIEILNEKYKGIIAIDGDLGGGKSIIANELSEKTQIPVVHVDDFLVPRTGRYVDSIQYLDLEKSIRKSGRPMIIEGICLLDVLNRIDLEHNQYFFIKRKENTPYKDSVLLSEIGDYIRRNSETINGARTLFMNRTETNQLDVDIVYLKSKTLVAVVLAIGGIAALAVGAYVLTSGISTQDSAVFKILGAEVSAEGIGAVILASSVLWAYFSYLARPKYSRRKEVRNETGADGSQRNYEFESSTMIAAKPPEKPF
ncbi:hypothetical protein ACMAZF_16485 [Psychrobium sp. nBUS_13]|uniref:hypothetical protein n=1 Tax=Psychrobium sp. nBUS_13 TaxID=3395319 RepID=UPI003EBDB20D